jgi:hypothetical protein
VEWLTEQEAEALIYNFRENRGGAGATEEEVARRLEWAKEQRRGAHLVDLALKCRVRITRMGNDEPTLVDSNGDRKLLYTNCQWI